MAEGTYPAMRQGWTILSLHGKDDSLAPASLSQSFKPGLTALLIAVPQSDATARSMAWVDEGFRLRTIDFQRCTDRDVWVAKEVKLWGGQYQVRLSLEPDGLTLTGRVINSSVPDICGSIGDIGEDIVGTFTAQVPPILDDCGQKRASEESPPGWFLWLSRLFGSRA